MARQSIPILTLTVHSTGALTARRFVTYAGARAGAAANTLGVARTDAASGFDTSVDVAGTAVVEAGAQVNAGQAVETDAQGRAVPQNAGPTVGRALAAAAGAGALFECVLIPN